MSITKNILRKHGMTSDTLDQLCDYARNHPKKENIIKNDISDISLNDPFVRRYKERNNIAKLFREIGIYSLVLAYTNKFSYGFIVRYKNGSLGYKEIDKNKNNEHVLYRDAMAQCLEHFLTKDTEDSIVLEF